MRVRTAIASTLLALGTPAAQAADSNEFLCEVTYWRRASVMDPNFHAPANEPKDNFRLRIMSPTQIRITGSNYFKNGLNTVRKSGNRYVFLGRHETSNNIGGRMRPTGEHYFDADKGVIRDSWESDWMMGTKLYLLYDGTCD